MKRALSVALIFLILLNTLGYYGVFLGWQYKSDLEMNDKIDSDEYNLSQSFTFAMPISIPYASDSRGFERAYGKFEHQGEFYHLVKQKLYRDTLYIVCVKDLQAKEIHRALTDYVKTFADAPLDAQSTHVKSVPLFIKDYISSVIGLKPQAYGWERVFSHSHQQEFSATAFSQAVNPPPES